MIFILEGRKIEKSNSQSQCDRSGQLRRNFPTTDKHSQFIENWFHAVFIDAYDWVMQTNVIGMGLFTDGGVLASKPQYAWVKAKN
ncbi:hypothetical protein [Nostoc sp.]|uniref:hypothetical protein n=1 Tax=Nostoc sp. TaxID=1180 RepID=UPI002FFA8701